MAYGFKRPSDFFKVLSFVPQKCLLDLEGVHPVKFCLISKVSNSTTLADAKHVTAFYQGLSLKQDISEAEFLVPLIFFGKSTAEQIALDRESTPKKNLAGI